MGVEYVQPDLFGIERGEADLRRAYQWIFDNYPIYAAMLERAREQADKGRRVAIDELFNWARYSLDWERDPREWKLDNTLRAPIARIMIKAYAPLADLMETRSARCDAAMGVSRHG